MDAFASSLERSPELFPHSYDFRSDAVSLVRLSRADYEKASFLDERAVGPHTLARAMPWGPLAAAVNAGRLEERCDYIFHIGHVGSTLLSRLLGVDRRIFALREPALLRLFALMRSEPDTLPRIWAAEEYESRLEIFLKLWSRTFEPHQSALLKATSFASELAPGLMARPAAPRALLLYVKPESYMATILGGPNARQEAKRLTAGRLKRLHKRIGREVWRLASLGEGEGLALSWVVEMAALAETREVGGERALLLDFDRFLEAPQETLDGVFRHFGCDDAPVGNILAGPLMQQYSKAPEHAYSPGLRREILDQARRHDGAAITKGLAWLERAANDVPLIGECLAMAAT